MFYKDSDGNRYRIGKSFTYQGYYYGTALANHPKFMELGFTQVIIAPRPDGNYYVVTGPDLDGQYTATPRNLADLKTNFKLEQKRTAHNTLRQTDWYVIRAAELGVVVASVPSAILTFRGAYRAASDARCAEIDACTTVEELEALMKAPAEVGSDTDNLQSAYVTNPAALTQWPEALATTYDYL